MTNDAGKRVLPPNPNPDHLRKRAKALLAEWKTRAPTARLADAQFALAREYGFVHWAELQAEAVRRAQAGRQIRFRRLVAVERFWRNAEPDCEHEAYAGFFRVGAAANIGFFFAAFAGVGMVCMTQQQMQTAHAVFERLASWIP